MTFKTYLSVFGSDDKKHDLERKFGYKFRALESVYPNTDKLPDDEIQKAIDVFYDGDANESIDVMLNRVKDYTVKNEPIWNEKYFNPKPKPMQTSLPQAQTNNLQSQMPNLMQKPKLKGFGDYDNSSNVNNLQFPTSFAKNNNFVPPQPRKPQFNLSNNVDYSKYGEDFSKEFIDEMLADNRFFNAMNKYVIPNEGGYVNNKNDRGGETNMGITKKFYPDEDIKNLTRERANAIYYRDYWKYNGINTLPDEIVGIVFDNAVIQGQGTAIKNLQRSIGVEDDGILGPITINALKNINYQKFKKDFSDNANAVEDKYQQKYPNQKIFEKGHRNRYNIYYK